MVSRKLNLKQLVTLSEVYWDDAAKLARLSTRWATASSRRRKPF